MVQVIIHHIAVSLLFTLPSPPAPRNGSSDSGLPRKGNAARPISSQPVTPFGNRI